MKLINPFNIPSPASQAASELAQAKRDHMRACAHREYYAAWEAALSQRIQRLEPLVKRYEQEERAL